MRLPRARWQFRYMGRAPGGSLLPTGGEPRDLPYAGDAETAGMLYFQVRPDRVFLAILHAALQRTREGLDFAPP